MRRKAWFLFVVLLSGAEVCAQDRREFLPLRVGNYWEYQYQEVFIYFKEFVKAIGDTVMPNGKRYLILRHRFSDGSEGQDYWRVDDSANSYEYQQFDTAEVLCDRLGASVGEWWMTWKYGACHATDSCNIFGMVIDTGHVGNRATKFIAYNESAPGPPGSGIFWSNDYFTEGIGLTYREYEAYSKQQLLGAIIDGVTIGVVSAAEQAEDVRTPGSPKLFQNFPNPFNPSTAIEYELPHDAIVGLKIFNLLGEEVATLAASRHSPGRQRITWNGRDRNGNRVSSGVYLYSLDTGQRRLTRKLVILR
jgi:hypothetical protein